MTMNNTTPQTNYDYFKQLWRDGAPQTKRKWRIFLAVFGGLWLAGAVAAFTSVAGIIRLGSGARTLTALAMGPFGLLWGFLKWRGLISETTQEPNLFWLVLLGINIGIIWLAGKILTGEPNSLVQQQRKQEAAEKAQGRLSQADIGEKLNIEQGVPAAQVDAGKKRAVTVGMAYETGEGHMLVMGPTRSGKGLHLTRTLMMWPGAAIVVDPKGEQFQRTAGERQQRFNSPIYRLPVSQVHLSYYYDHLLDRDSLFELHHHLLRPWQSRERIFADKSRALFSAAAEYAKVLRLNPVRVLLDMADSDPVTALTALETVPAAQKYVRLFTDGLSPEKYYDNRFATSAYGTFTTMLNGYQKHIDTIAPTRNGPTVIPRDWAAQGATIYVTYSLNDLQGVGGVVAAVMAAFMRYQLRQPKQERVLFAIDELPAAGLHNVTDYLATVGGSGITLLLYAQAVSQLRDLYGHKAAG
jgi:type IV secretory pathway TraG/TraD family ATPase VirD4